MHPSFRNNEKLLNSSQPCPRLTFPFIRAIGLIFTVLIPKAMKILSNIQTALCVIDLHKSSCMGQNTQDQLDQTHKRRKKLNKPW